MQRLSPLKEIVTVSVLVDLCLFPLLICVLSDLGHPNMVSVTTCSLPACRVHQFGVLEQVLIRELVVPDEFCSDFLKRLQSYFVVYVASN